MENQSFTVNGSWSNGATFWADTNSTVVFAGTNDATLWNNSTFYNLTGTNAGKVLKLQAGKTNVVNGKLTLNNATLKSTAPGAWAYLRLDANAMQDVQHVTVSDNNATNGPTIRARSSSDLGHNVNWFFQPAPGTVFMVR